MVFEKKNMEETNSNADFKGKEMYLKLYSPNLNKNLLQHLWYNIHEKCTIFKLIISNFTFQNLDADIYLLNELKELTFYQVNLPFTDINRYEYRLQHGKETWINMSVHIQAERQKSPQKCVKRSSTIAN